MNPGTEELVKKVQSVTNGFNTDGDLVKPAYRVLTFQERVDRWHRRRVAGPIADHTQAL